MKRCQLDFRRRWLKTRLYHDPGGEKSIINGNDDLPVELFDSCKGGLEVNHHIQRIWAGFKPNQPRVTFKEAKVVFSRVLENLSEYLEKNG